jgi:hypothetical protein
MERSGEIGCVYDLFLVPVDLFCSVNDIMRFRFYFFKLNVMKTETSMTRCEEVSETF